MQNSTDAGLDERLARDWGLRPEEWARYRQLMQGPLGIYSPNLDPLTALGIEGPQRRGAQPLRGAAGTGRVAARGQDAGLSARLRRCVAAPVSRPAAREPARRTGSRFRATGLRRLAVFVKADCPPCEQRVRQLQAAGTAFDLYMVGSRQDDARVRHWAVQAGIDPRAVRGHTITLNHDGGPLVVLSLPGELPAVVREGEQPMAAPVAAARAACAVLALCAWCRSHRPGSTATGLPALGTAGGHTLASAVCGRSAESGARLHTA